MGITISTASENNTKPKVSSPIQKIASTKRQGRRSSMAGPQKNDRITTNWSLVAEILDELPPNTTCYIGQIDTSTATHLKNGRVSSISPKKYDIWTQWAGDRSRYGQSALFMRKKGKNEVN